MYKRQHLLNIKQEDKNLIFVTICSYIESGPSFVYYRTVTEFKALVQKYRRDHFVEEGDVLPVVNKEEPVDIELPADIMDSLDLKKSTFLAELMLHRKDEDIQFEQFHLYDEYLSQTLEKPDEIYEFVDEEGDSLNTYIKSFKLDSKAFYYVVICYPYTIIEENKKALLPILTFPSIDNELYPLYAKGNKLNNQLKN